MILNCSALLKRLGSDEAGTIAIMSGLLLPVTVGAMGLAVDYTFAARDRAALQATADTTALALARELAVANPNAARAQAIGGQIAHDELKRRKLDDEAAVTATVASAQGRVTVEIKRPRRAFFAKLFGQTPGAIGAKSVASLAGRRKICVVTLDPSAAGAMEMKDTAWLTTEGCDVFADSTNASAIKTAAGNKIESSLVCSAGGIAGSATITGERLTDCPPVPDPLASRPPPPDAPCTATKFEVKDKGGSPTNRFTVYPGTYCEGLKIKAKTFVTFAPGVYVIKDGEFRIDNDADVVGDHVGFYLSGEKAELKFKDKAKIWLNAPKDGPLAGLLFFEDRSVSLNRQHDITSDFVSNMTGTIYMPRGRLLVDAAYDVAQESAFTLIVAHQIRMENSPRLVVNSDYGLTDVPVPAGLGLVNAPVRLTN